MSAFVLVSGSLFRAPEQRTSKAGKPFVAATLKAKDGETAQWWKVLAFSESAQAELMRLTDGDALSVQGALKVEEYEKEGQNRVSLGVIADHALALRQSPLRSLRQAQDQDTRAPLRSIERNLTRHDEAL
jgi:single-stranded DNA-binding protein